MTVFPTPVGVFLLPAISGLEKSGLPHARGGVSPQTESQVNAFLSSPRPWGCFLHKNQIQWKVEVFPTPVGVFLSSLQNQ